MADDQEKTEVYYFFNDKGTSPFIFASRYGTKENLLQDFCEFF